MREFSTANRWPTWSTHFHVCWSRRGTHRELLPSSVLGLISVPSLWFMTPPPNQSYGPVNLHRAARVMFLNYTSCYFPTLMEILLHFYHLKLKPSCCIIPLTLFNLSHSILRPLSTNSYYFLTCAESPWLFQALPWLRIFLHVLFSPLSLYFPSAWLIFLYSLSFNISVIFDNL